MKIAGFEKVIKKSPLFSSLAEDQLSSVVSEYKGTVKKYSKDEIIHQSYTPLPKFGLVLSGSIQVWFDEMIMATVSTGETFGESICYLRITDSPVYIVATTDCSILWLSVCEKYLSSFTALLATRALSMNDRIQVLSKINLRDKLMTYFKQMSAKYGKTFTVPFNRESMATYIGTNRSALSRELSRMKAERIIDFYRETFKLL